MPLVVRLLLTWSSFTLLTASIGIISTRRHPTRRREQREAGARAACDPHELPRDRRPERGDVGSVESYELLSYSAEPHAPDRACASSASYTQIL